MLSPSEQFPQEQVPQITARESVILSDFDYTLCHSYKFDPSTNNHLPQIEPEVAEAAQEHHLIIATGRRAEHPSIPLMWESGLVAPERPVITENGGCLAYNTGDSKPRCIDLIDTKHLPLLKETRKLAAEHVTDIPPGHRLAFKMGRTMLLARIQDQEGVCPPELQTSLAAQVRRMVPEQLSVFDTRASVTIQHSDISKSTGFAHYLKLCGLQRSEVFVIGMGDAPNDQPIFATSDIRIGFSEAVHDMVDVNVPAGAQAAALVLRSLVKSTPVGHPNK